MKKACLTLILIISAAMLTGCFDYVDIEEKAMVAGLAIDISENGEYMVSAEILASPSSGTEAEITPKYMQAKGNTIYDACQMMYNSSSKQIDFGQCKIIFISQKFAEKGIEPLFDIIFHNRQLTLSIDLVVIKNTDEAFRIFEVEPLLTSVISYDISKTLEANTINFSSIPRGEAYKCLNAIEEVGRHAVLPNIEIEFGEYQNQFKITGISYFLKDKLAGHVDTQDSIYYMMLTNKFKNCTIPLNIETEKDGEIHVCKISPEVRDLSLKTKVLGDKDNLKLVLNFEYNLLLNEITTELPIERKGERKDTENKIADAIKNNFIDFISRVQKEYKCDFLKFGNTIYHTRPELKQMIADEWDERFPDLNFEVNVKVKIKSSGTSKFSIECD